MKTLEQLCISPAPWNIVPYGERTNSKVATHVDVEFANGESAFMKDGGAQLQEIANARLIAAAPELYEALRMYQEAFEEIRKSAWFIDANFYEIMNLNKVMTAADAALAKAAGESEVHQ